MIKQTVLPQTTNHYVAIRRNTLQIHTNVHESQGMTRDRSPSPKVMDFCTYDLIYITCNNQGIAREDRLVVALGRAQG